MFTQNTLQKELLDLIQQTTSLIKEDTRSTLRISPEDYQFFNPPISKQPAILKAKPLVKPQESKQKPLEKPILPPLDRWPSIRSTLQKIAPNMKLLDTIPDDLPAQKVANAWSEQTEVLIITGSASSEELLFLKDLARSIHDRLCPTKLISGTKLEKENSWKSFFEKSTFKLVLITQVSQQYPELMLYHKQATTSLVILEPLETYKQPDQKTALWKSLCQILAPAASSP